MNKIFWQSLAIAPAIFGAAVLTGQSAIAAPDATANSAQAVQSLPSLPTGQAASDILRNRDRLKQFSVNESGDSMNQVTSVSELRDVAPTEWAYEALRSLVERYGCIVGYPDRTYRGNRALTRWEFAAGLNACMNTMERLIQENAAVLKEDIDKLKRLAQEFQTELAALGARVDNLESRVSFLEDHQFSTTTKLKGEVIFAASGAWGGRALDQREQNLADLGRINDPGIDDQVTLSDRVRLNLETSFTGKDMLRTRLQAANIPQLQNATGTETARLAFDENSNNNVQIDDLFYRFPIGNLTTWIGANGLNLDDVFDVGNPYMNSSGTGALARVNRYNPLTFRGPSGAGIGLAYKFNNMFQIRGTYLAGNASDPTEGQGLFNGSFSAGAQLVAKPFDTLSIGATYVHSYWTAGQEQQTSNAGSYVDDSVRNQVIGGTRRALGRGIGRDPFLGSPATRDSYGLNLDWRITDMFNLSAYGGYALASAQGFDTSGKDRDGFGADIWTWNLALNVIDIGKEGAVFTVAGGLAPTTKRVDAYTGDLTVPDQDNTYIIETQYQYPLTKNILLTPGAYVILNPDGNSNNNSVWVGVLRTTFKF